MLSYTQPQIPDAPRAIQKGVPLNTLLDEKAVNYLAKNIKLFHDDFEAEKFIAESLQDITELSLMDRGRKIAAVLHQYLPQPYKKSLDILLQTFTEARYEAEEFGLAEFFYLPHSFFIAEYGLGDFEISMQAQYELTQRFTAEFSIRPFLIHHQEKTLQIIQSWINDKNPHVRRLCSEGIRPKLPWGKRIPALIKDPSPILPILESLKDDDSLYVRRSIANNLGDIAKDHPLLVFDLCREWLKGASKERKWLIRHALRYHAKKENKEALELRALAK